MAATVVAGVALVGLGVVGSSDRSPSLDELVRRQIENDDLSTRGGGASTGAVPEPRPPTTVGTDDEVMTPSGDPATEPSGPVDSAAPPADDTAGADPASSPLPLGTAAPVGQRYVVAMTAVDLDATDLIVAEAPTNEPPAATDTYVLVTLDVQFTGLVGEAEPYFDLLVGAVDAGGRVFNDIDCLPITPGDMYGQPPIGPGEARVGTFCLVVPVDATDGLTFFVEEHESIVDTRAWWSRAD